MAIETHSVTASDVLDETDVVQSRITSTSQPLNTDQVDSWIKRAAARVNALLVGRDMDPSSLGDNVKFAVQSAIIAWARAKVLEKTNRDDAEIDRAWSEYRDMREAIKSGDRDMGADIDEAAEVRAPNVDTSDTKSSTDWGTDYQP
ncbi:MAG: hypothetical protein ABEN55_16265 [Bradymonadaceae bacterium]